MRIVKVAYVVAFLLAGLTVVCGFTTTVIALPFALIPLIAGIGILRRRVWSAYGLALYQAVQLLLLPIAFFRSEDIAAGRPELLISGVFALLLVALFFQAGRSLQRSDHKHGIAAPWIILAVLCTVPIFCLQAFILPSSSMEDTILLGDRILVQRWPKKLPVRGDIVVFVYPMDPQQTYVKRVIGIPGDRIRIANKAVFLNGTALQEPYAVHKTGYVDSYRDNFPSEPNLNLFVRAEEMLQKNVERGEVVVPQGNFFVLGDNRDSSLDSRYWGFVPTANLLGSPVLIYDSEDTSTGTRRVRWNRLFTRP